VKTPQRYKSAVAFRIALEARLKSLSRSERIDLQRMRRQVSFDRLLARLFSARDEPWLLKGGYAMELRLKTARATKDIDLAIPGEALKKKEILEQLQNRAAKDLGDCFVFTVGFPEKDLDGPPEGGFRFPITARIAGRVFTKFHLDVGVGDTLVMPTETVLGRDWLGFADIPSVVCTAISKEQQFAEKFHAYTRQRQRPNSRVKDLVDMALLVKIGLPDSLKLHEAIRSTFAQRGTQEPLAVFPNPPKFCLEPFTQLALECGLEWSMDESVSTISALLNKG
jgi:hypothetical protein